MPATIEIGSATIHRIVEQEGPFFDAMQFFPTITGDMIHSPLQARYPEPGMMADCNSVQAAESRPKLFGRFCDTSTVMCTAHLPSPSTARVVRCQDAFDFVDV